MAKNLINTNTLTKLNDIKNEVEKVVEKDEGLFKIESIHIDEIIRNEKNFYEIVEIETLANDIKENGLHHNIVVRKKDDKYEILSGERRYQAHRLLVSQGHKQYSFIPCKIENLDDIDSEIVLIQSNAQSRELSEIEKLKQVERLTELHALKKKKEGTKGSVRDFVAKDIGLKPTQVQRYTTINQKLIPKLKELIETEELTIANASEFATLTEEQQNLVYDLIKNKIDITKSEANRIKKQFKEVEEEKELLSKEYLEKIKLLENENKEKDIKLKDATENINKKILEVKEEMEGKSEKEQEAYLDELKKFEDEKRALEIQYKDEKNELENALENLQKENEKIISQVEEEIKIKSEKIMKDFESEKKKLRTENESIKLENEKLKKELENKEFDDREKKAIYETKITLTKLKSDVIRVTSLMKNIPSDEEILKNIESLCRLFEGLESTIKIHVK
ncbi:ParB N-terminal domain-containing protein [Clostridioides difficile]|nr:ParB N-terminal domain-containing protein [Clostridioides difficile]VHX22242.1 ParB protein [Clostridioides difficile]